MAKHIFKRYFPAHKVREHKHFKRFLHIFHHHYLWHLNRHSTAKGFLVGMFSCFMPMQMLLAAALSLLFRGNLPVSVLLVWISNPFTYLPIFYFSYKIGLIFVGTPISYEAFIWDWSLFTNIWQPLLLGSIINGVVFGVSSYLIVLAFWRWHIISKYNKRKKLKVHEN